MKVKLSDIQPNPFRDFAIDPLDEARVAQLRESMKEWKLLPGLVGRRVDGVIQQAFGHHRKEAAVAEGIEVAEVHLDDYSDDDMVRLYAMENATQRGVIDSTAMAGCIAAAIRHLYRRQFVPDMSISPASGRNADKRKDIGEPDITFFLNGTGVGKHAVLIQLANLKSSGLYDRIIDETIEDLHEEIRLERERLEREQAEAEQRAQAEKDKRARAAAEAQRRRAEKQREELKQTEDRLKDQKDREKQDDVFDFTGVAKYLKKPSHVEAFRKIVVKEQVPRDQQAELARQIYKTLGDDVTAKNIEYELWKIRHQEEERSRLEEEKRRLRELRRDWTEQAKEYQRRFASICCELVNALELIAEHEKSRPEKATFLMEAKFKDSLEVVSSILSRIEGIYGKPPIKLRGD